MKGVQNQVERFRSIAKRLVDEHSAEVFVWSALCSEKGTSDVYYSHLDDLNKELKEQAEQFIRNFKSVDDNVKSEIWSTCRKYIEQFARRNQPNYY